MDASLAASIVPQVLDIYQRYCEASSAETGPAQARELVEKAEAFKASLRLLTAQAQALPALSLADQDVLKADLERELRQRQEMHRDKT